MTTTTEIPTDPTTIAIQQVADIISQNAVWQASVSKYSADEAREFVIKSYVKPPEGLIEHPWAIVFELPGGSWERLGDGVNMPRGELFLILIRPADTEDTELEERRFNNWHGSIVEDLARYNAAGYRIQPTLTDAPEHTAPKDRPVQSYWSVGYTLAWGPF